MFKRVLAVVLVIVGILLYLGVCSAAVDTKAKIESDAYNKYVADLYAQDVYYNMPDFDDYDDYVDYVDNLDIEYEPFVSDLDIGYIDDAIFDLFDDSKIYFEEFYLPEFDEPDEQIFLSTLYKPSLSDDDYKLFYSLNLTPTEYVSKMGWKALGGQLSSLFDLSHPRGDFIAVFDEAFLSESAKEQGYKYLHLACRTDYLFVPRFLIVDDKEHLIFNVYVKKDDYRQAHETALAGSDMTDWDYISFFDGVVVANDDHVVTTTTPGSNEPPTEWVELRYDGVPFYVFPIAWNGQFCNVGLPVYDSQGNIETYYLGGNNNTVYCFYISYTKPDQQARFDFEQIGYDYRHYMIAHATSDSSKIATQNEESVMRLRYSASHTLLLGPTDADLSEYLPQFHQVFKSGLFSYGTFLLNAVPELDALVAPLSFLLSGVGIIIGSADNVISGFGSNFFVSVAVISIFISLLGICLGFYEMLSSQGVSIVHSYVSKKPAKRKTDLSVWDYKEIEKNKELTSNDVKRLKGGD